MNRATAEEAPPIDGDKPGHRRHWRLRPSWSIFIALVFGVASVLAYNAISSVLAHRWDASQPRDETTGILLGAEPILLGPPNADTAVVLVHGFIGASTNFGELPVALASAGYRVHAIRLPGNGTTPFDLRETSADDMLHAVRQEIQSLREKHERVFIVGHSMGGTLSTLAASLEEVDGLVLAAPYYRVTHQWYYILRPETWSGLTGWAIKWAYKGDRFIRVNRQESKDDILSYRWIPAYATQQSGELAQRARNRETLENIDCPVLLMHSPNDFAASPQAAEEAFETLTSEDKSFLWLDNSDHHLFWDHDRDEAVAAVLEFIEDHAAL